MRKKAIMKMNSPTIEKRRAVFNYNLHMDKKLKYKEKLRENKSVMRKKDSSPFLDYKKCLKCEL